MGTKSIATNRLKLILMQDRIDFDYSILEMIKSDAIKTFSNNKKVNMEEIELSIERIEDHGVFVPAIVASIPRVVFKNHKVKRDNWFKNILSIFKATSSKDLAVNRLRIMLIDDEVKSEEGFNAEIKEKFLHIVKSYMEIEELRLKESSGEKELKIDIPIKTTKNNKAL